VVIAEHCPDVMAVETAFYHKSARSTLVLGHVRGVVLLAARESGLPVDEYAPREIKMAVTGSGGAAKEQVAFMVRGLLKLPEIISIDASDALAVAICHWHRSRLPA
jgi:crossover junction endodeoxyribonuclease RuvC